MRHWQVARIQQQVLDALKQAPQSNPAVQDAIARLNSQLFDISMVRLSQQCCVEFSTKYIVWVSEKFDGGTNWRLKFKFI